MRIEVEPAPGDASLNHNCVQLAGEKERVPRPHADSSKLCRYAAALYLDPKVPDDCGTSFYRQRLPSGQLGGNMVSGPHANLVHSATAYWGNELAEKRMAAVFFWMA